MNALLNNYLKKTKHKNYDVYINQYDFINRFKLFLNFDLVYSKEYIAPFYHL